MRTARVIVEKYNPQWKADFEMIAREIISSAGDLILTVEHVGSAAVEGLSAKPIIDLDLVIKESIPLSLMVERLAEIGYIHEGNLGIEGREAFRYTDKPHLRPHHLYACFPDSGELRRHIAFRDYLRAHPEDAKRYGKIKEEAAALYPLGIESYINYKSSFIQMIYHQCGLDTE